MASRAYAYKAQENSSIRTFVLYFQALLAAPGGTMDPGMITLTCSLGVFGLLKEEVLDQTHPE